MVTRNSTSMKNAVRFMDILIESADMRISLETDQMNSVCG